MIKTEELLEFLRDASLPYHMHRSMAIEKINIIAHRLKYLDQLKEEVSNTYAGITASELFENNDL